MGQFDKVQATLDSLPEFSGEHEQFRARQLGQQREQANQYRPSMSTGGLHYHRSRCQAKVRAACWEDYHTEVGNMSMRLGHAVGTLTWHWTKMETRALERMYAYDKLAYVCSVLTVVSFGAYPRAEGNGKRVLLLISC